MRWNHVCAGLLLGSLLLVSPISAPAQDLYTLTLTDATGSTGLPVEVHVILESSGSPIQGWSFGVCHDEEDLDFIGALEGPSTLTAKNGQPADFTQVNEEPGGMTMGAVICFTACATLPNGTHDLLESTYLPLAPAGSAPTLDFCATLGSPVIHTVVVVDGASQVPAMNSGTISVVSPNDLRIGTAFGAPGMILEVPVTLTNVVPVDGVQVAFTFDENVLDLVSAEAAGPALAADFFAVPTGLLPGEVGLGLVMDISPPLDNQLPIGDEVPIFALGFEIDPAAIAPVSVPLAFTPAVGTPPLHSTLVTGQTQDTPNLFDGAIEVVDYHPFIRGDCNSDDIVNIADGIVGLYFLFVAGTAIPGCLDACDANDDGFLDTADPITVFAWQFNDGPEPPAPFPSEGIDPTPGEGIGCDGDIDDVQP